MRAFAVSLVLMSAVSLKAFAGGAVSWRNLSTGISLTSNKFSDNLEVCDSKGSECMTFKPTGDMVGKKLWYVETNGKCKLSVEDFTYDHADGTTHNEYMLNVHYRVIRVEQFEDNCTLESSFGGKRSLTGIYL